MVGPMTATTIFFTGKNKVEVSDEPAPQPKAGELLVQATRTLISTGTEGICLSRNFAPGTSWEEWVQYPFKPGYMHMGRVVAIGEGVEGWQVGDRVASAANHSSLVTVPAKLAARVPKSVSDEEAAWAVLGRITQLGVRAAKHEMGDTAVVIGLGMLGQLVVQYARLMGCQEVIAIDTAPMRLELARKSGATAALQMTAAEALRSVKTMTAGRRADVVYDVTGHHAVFATALPLARKFGTVILLGDTGMPDRQTLTGDVIQRGLRIVGVHAGHAPDEATDYQRWTRIMMDELFLKYVADRRMSVKGLITHRYNVADAAQAYELLLTRRDTAMGVMIEWQ